MLNGNPRYIYVTVPGKRAQVAHNINLCIGGFSATTPKNKPWDITFVFVSEVSPTHAKFENMEALL